MNAELTANLAACSSEVLTALGETVTIAGVDYNARVQSIPHDQTFMEGGLGNAEFRVWTTKSALPVRTAKMAVVVARGLTRNVLDVTERDTTWILTVGLPGSNG